MTAAEKFSLARAQFHAIRKEPPEPPLVQQAIDCQVRAVANVCCPDPDENTVYRRLVLNRDNWIAQDNPFRDDAEPTDGQAVACINEAIRAYRGIGGVSGIGWDLAIYRAARRHRPNSGAAAL